MSKMRHVPIDDALRQFRFNALNTPLVAKDMTTLDKEMSDILSRTDLSKEHKLKKYYEALGKFQEARNIFKGISNTNPADVPNSTQIKEVEKILKKEEKSVVKNDDDDDDDDSQASVGLNSLFGDEYATANSMLDDGNAQFSTPSTDPTISSTPRSSQISKTETPKNSRGVSKDKIQKNEEWDKVKMKKEFLNTINLKNNAIRVTSPSRGGPLKNIGTVDQLDKVFDYLFSKKDDATTPKFKGNRRNNILMQNVVHFLKNNPGRNWEKKYPILADKFSSVKGTGRNQQKGFGKAKINYKQWDYLNKKLNL
jgi:hypothetical protein